MTEEVQPSQSKKIVLSERLIKYSPLIGAFLVFLGLLKLDLYYRHFGINIVEYLDFGEIVTSFLDDLNIIFLSGLLILFYMMAGNTVFNKILSWGSGYISHIRPEKVNADVLGRRATKSINGFLGFGIALLSGACSLWLLFEYDTIWILFISVILLYQIFVYILDTINRILLRMSQSVFRALLIALFFPFFIGILAILEIRRLEASKTQVYITTDSGIIKAEGLNRLIGKTDKFIFIHNIKSHENMIVPMQTVKLIIFK